MKEGKVMRDETLENYLKTIYQIQQKKVLSTLSISQRNGIFQKLLSADVSIF